MWGFPTFQPGSGRVQAGFRVQAPQTPILRDASLTFKPGQAGFRPQTHRGCHDPLWLKPIAAVTLVLLASWPQLPMLKTWVPHLSVIRSQPRLMLLVSSRHKPEITRRKNEYFGRYTVASTTVYT